MESRVNYMSWSNTLSLFLIFQASLGSTSPGKLSVDCFCFCRKPWFISYYGCNDQSYGHDTVRSVLIFKHTNLRGGGKSHLVYDKCSFRLCNFIFLKFFHSFSYHAGHCRGLTKGFIFLPTKQCLFPFDSWLFVIRRSRFWSDGRHVGPWLWRRAHFRGRGDAGRGVKWQFWDCRFGEGRVYLFVYFFCCCFFLPLPFLVWAHLNKPFIGQEGNMPLEELLALYRYEPPVSTVGCSSADSSSVELTDELPDMTLDKVC